MKRGILALMFTAALATVAQAHFAYLLPSADGSYVQLVFSDGLAPDKSVPISKVAGTKLTFRANGKDTPLKTQQVENDLKAEAAGTGHKVIFGHTDYGVVQKGEGKPFYLNYYPKTILGDPFAQENTIGKDTVIEIVPVREGTKVKFLVLASGKPLPDAEVFLRMPGDDANETLKTDATGQTAAYAETGRYAVVARKLDAKAGEKDSKKYDETRHYATLVVDISKHK